MSSTAEFGVLRRDRDDRRPRRTRLDAFPRDPLRRWMLRLGLIVPMVFFALVDQLSPLIEGTPNDDLLADVQTIDWSRGDAQWLAELYPHMSMLIASANPLGRLGLSLVGAVAAGFLLQKVAEILAQRAIPASTGIILVIALAANPLFVYFALENLPGFLAITFFGLALADLVRFVNWGNTESGFRAGILIMLSALSDPTGILFAVIGVLAAPFLRHGRAHAPGLRAANMLVIGFPTVGAFATIAMLNVAFFGTAWPGLDLAHTFGLVPERFALLIAGYGIPDGWLLLASVASAWLVALIVRRPAAIPVSAIVFVLLNAAFLLGMFHPGAAGITFTLLTLLAITLIPAARTRTTNVLVDVVAVLQIVIAWTAALEREVVVEWMLGLAAASLELFG